jgi:ribose 5-phosphate isomerase RpiB
MCGGVVGASLYANKVPKVRTGLVDDHFSAQQRVRDDNVVRGPLG